MGTCISRDRSHAALLAFAIAMASIVGAWCGNAEGFIRSVGTQFADRNCQEFAFSGFNSWDLIETSAGGPSTSPPGSDSLGGIDLLKSAFKSAKENGLTVGRFFGGGNAGGIPFQIQPGIYNGLAIKALDVIINEARENGVRVTIALSDYKHDVDGAYGYPSWAGKTAGEFYTDATIKAWFKNHISFLVNRINEENGIRYGDDDHILSWNLMNEPRCDCSTSASIETCNRGCFDEIQSWIAEMSSFLKQQDPVHMVTVGEEGFYSLGRGRKDVNPDAFTNLPRKDLWTRKSGQDFRVNHNLTTIDYSAIHSWPDNWAAGSIGFQEQWIRKHIPDAQLLNMPLVVEAFGKSVDMNDDESRVAIRDPFFASMYNLFLSEVDNNSPLKGVCFWELDARTDAGASAYAVQSSHSTWDGIIVPNTQSLMNRIMERPLVENCLPGEFRSSNVIIMHKPSVAYYVSNGPGILDVDEGIDIQSSLTFSTPADCAHLCEAMPDCDSFTYMPNKNGGSCFMKRGANTTIGSQWNIDEWQSFHRKEGSRSCSIKDCSLCTAENMCLRCEKGRLLHRSEDGKLSCRACEEFPISIQKRREECQGAIFGRADDRSKN